MNSGQNRNGAIPQAVALAINTTQADSESAGPAREYLRKQAKSGRHVRHV